MLLTVRIQANNRGESNGSGTPPHLGVGVGHEISLLPSFLRFISRKKLEEVLLESLPVGMEKEFDNYRRIVDPPLQSINRKGKKIVLDGPIRCGKSTALAMLVHWARDEGWLLLYVPEGAGVGRMKDVDLMAMHEGSSLYDLVQMGIITTHASIGVVVRLMEELSLVKDIHVLFDGFWS
uniref:Small ribosomal subunit protein mS29 n=1 Tax=Lactuca sativa TaxID=4236 RepID=A0A9R1XRL3_LACSA|nr:hypothetical protein LSAT_V11C300120170 [Lactuca sativa]